MKKETMKSDQANAARPFIRQEKSRSEANSYDYVKAEGKDVYGDESSSESVDDEEAGDDDVDEEAGDDDVDEEAEGNDVDDEETGDDDFDNDEKAEGNDVDYEETGDDDFDNDEEAEGNDVDDEETGDDDFDNDEEAEGNDVNDGEAEGNDVDDEEAEGNDVDDDEEAEGNDVDDEEAEGNDVDNEEAEGNDVDNEEAEVGEENPSGPKSPLTPKEGLDMLLAVLAKRPESFEADTVFQEVIKYSLYKPFDQVQPFDAGKVKHYVSSLVRPLLACAQFSLLILNVHRLILTQRLYTFTTRSSPLFGTQRIFRMQLQCRCTNIRLLKRNPSFSWEF